MQSDDNLICGNEFCDFSEKKVREEILEILQKCGKKTIGDVGGVPEYRACPACGQVCTCVCCVLCLCVCFQICLHVSSVRTMQASGFSIKGREWYPFRLLVREARVYPPP